MIIICSLVYFNATKNEFYFKILINRSAKSMNRGGGAFTLYKVEKETSSSIVSIFLSP